MCKDGEFVERLIAVDMDISVQESHAKEWGKYGIGTFRVDSMSEAILRLASGYKYLLVFINEDSVPGFASQLEIMRDVTKLPIFIFSSNYSIKKKIEYLELGADMYDPFSEYVNDDVLDVLEELKVFGRWANHPSTSTSVLIGGDVILSESRRVVFVKDKKVHLTKLEFDILFCLMRNMGRTVTHTQIMQAVWGDEYEDAEKNVLWNAIKRLRIKLKTLPDSPEYIETVRDIGYCFPYKT